MNYFLKLIIVGFALVNSISFFAMNISELEKIDCSKLNLNDDPEIVRLLMLDSAMESPDFLQGFIENEESTSYPDRPINSQPIYAAFLCLNKDCINLLLKSGVKLDQRYKGILEHKDKMITLQEAFSKGFFEHGGDFSKPRALLNHYLQNNK